MNAGRSVRICKEINEIMNDCNGDGISIEVLSDNNYRMLRGVIFAPADSPYEGGRYLVDIEIPQRFPFEHPKLSFKTKIWHPNICSKTGTTCLELEWTSAITLKAGLLTLQGFLSSPDADDPQDALVARQYKEDRDLFAKTASFWAYYFANAPAPSHTDYVQKLEKVSELGVNKEEALRTLSVQSWNVESVIEHFTKG